MLFRSTQSGNNLSNNQSNTENNQGSNSNNTGSSNNNSDPDMSEIEQITKEQFLKDNEEAKANGATIREGDALTDQDIEDIGKALNGG